MMSNSRLDDQLRYYDELLDKAASGSLTSWSDENESVLLEPYRYYTSSPGKEIRGKLIEAFNIWLNVPEVHLKRIAKIVAMLHNASLLVDDIEDDSQLRRGKPVAHKIYGIPQTINTANYVYFQAFRELASLQVSQEGQNSDPSTYSGNEDRTPKSMETVVNSELLALHRGQGLDLYWRDSLRCPTEEEYLGMVCNTSKETGGLFRLAVRLMSTCATTNKDVDYIPLVNLIGIYFQIRDDYMNLQDNEYNAAKGFAEDLTEGKFSFPIIHGIRANPKDHQILNVLQKRTTSSPLKKHVISFLEQETKSLQYTFLVIQKLEKQIRSEVDRLGGNPAVEGIINVLASGIPVPRTSP